MVRRRRGLTPEERELWSRIARTATPLHCDRPEPKPPASTAGKGALPPPKPPVTPLPDFRIGQSATPRGTQHPKHRAQLHLPPPPRCPSPSAHAEGPA